MRERSLLSRVRAATLAGFGVVLCAICASPGFATVYLDGPAVLDRNGETYVVTQDFTCSGTAFTVAANEVVLDLGGHTVTYGSGTTESYGVFLPASWQSPTGREGVNSEIRNGTLVQAASGTARYCHGVYSNEINNTSGPVIHDLTVHTHTACSRGIYLRQSGYGVNIYDNVFYVSNLKVSRDETTEAIGLVTTSGGTPSARGIIRNNTVHTGAQGVVLSSGTSYVDAYANDITIGAPAAEAKNCYAIMVVQSNYCHVYDNTVFTDSGRGILVDWTASNNEIYSNDVDVSDSTGTQNVYGIRVRFGACHNSVYHNTVVVRDSSFDLDAFYLGGTEQGLCRGNVIYENSFRNVNPDKGSGVRIIDVGSGNVIRDNVITSNHVVVRMGEPSTSPVQLRSNTLVKGPAAGGSYSTFFAWGDHGSAGPHVVLDAVCQNGADLQDVDYGGYGGSFDVQWYLTVLVQDTAANALPGAYVEIRNRFGTVAFTGETGADGTVTAPITQYRESSSGDSYYTPHTILASLDTFTSAPVEVTVDSSQQVVVTLMSTSKVKLSLSADVETALPGDTITYTIAYSNDTAEAALNVVIEDSIPTNTTYVAGSTKHDGVPVEPDPYSDGRIRVPIGDVGPGDSGTVEFQVQVQ